MTELSSVAGKVAFARPHFRREGDELYFFLSSRPFHRLNAEEAELWAKLEAGPVSLDTGSEKETGKAMAEAGLVEVIAPVRAKDRRQVLVVEPHCDDAALSIGGTMWKMRNDAEFHLLTMASRSNYSTAFHLHRDYFDRSKITAMRAAEGELFTRHLGGHYYCADLPEATLRYKDSDWDLQFFEGHEVATAISNNRRAPPAVLNQWTEYLRQFLSDRTFDEIWLPLGAGTHSDHNLARDAGLRTILDLKPSGTIRLYEDVPYGAQFREHTDRILEAMERAGATLSPWPQDVTAELPVKLTLLNIFASQFKVGAILGGVERSASRESGGQKTEHLWTLEALPAELPEDQMWIGAPDVANVARELQKFREGAYSETRVAIFAINASGRWRDDIGVLSEVFPRARFIVYAGPRVSAEFQELKDPDGSLERLDGHSSSWVKAALREFATGHRIVIAGDATRKAKALRIFWPRGRTLIVPAMDNLFQALASS